jgi:hypothetical protein
MINSWVALGRPNLDVRPAAAASRGVASRTASIARTAALAMCACAACSPWIGGASGPSADRSATAGVASRDTVLAGWFHTVWGERPQYLLVDDQSRSTELLISDDLLRSLGGVGGVDRRRVRARGRLVIEPQRALRVSFVEIDTLKNAKNE